MCTNLYVQYLACYLPFIYGILNKFNSNSQSEIIRAYSLINKTVRDIQC